MDHNSQYLDLHESGRTWLMDDISEKHKSALFLLHSILKLLYAKCQLDSRNFLINFLIGRLVIVKFVTVARYNQRFPDALTCTQPLEVSGEFPSSLSWNSQEAESPSSKKK